MAKPRRIHMHRLRRLGRRLVKYLTEVYKCQEAPKELVAYADSDWAQDPRTSKSMSGYVEMFGSHIIETSCARQATVALSSGEAECHVLTRVKHLEFRELWLRTLSKGSPLARMWRILGLKPYQTPGSTSWPGCCVFGEASWQQSWHHAFRWLDGWSTATAKARGQL